MSIFRGFAPATVANVSCGFDVFGFAVNAPGDIVEINVTGDRQVVVKAIHNDGGLLPTDTDKNTAAVAVQSFLDAIRSDLGAEITLYKNLPLGSGMGSSAASAAAALVAINAAHGYPKEKKELIQFAVEAERVASGSAHADNVSPSLLGGFVLIRDTPSLDIINIPVPGELICVLAHPAIEINTRVARQLLKQTISLQAATAQWANTAALVAGMLKEDYELIGRSLEDAVAEPIRAQLIPGFSEIKKAAIEAGALGCGISGSGPSIFSLCKGTKAAEKVVTSVQAVFDRLGLGGEFYISPINNEGARIL